MSPLASRPLPVLLVLSLLAGLLAPGSSGAQEAGHWEVLGEDGRVWVPARAPAVTNLPAPGLGDYHDHLETEHVLFALAAEHPDLFSLSSIGTSVQGRAIWLMSVTGPGDASARPRVLLDGAHHGDEVIGSEVLVRFLLHVAATYGSDAAMRGLLENVVVDVVPMVNPDGVALVPDCTHYAMCRKNANGVDLNRNYPDHWGGSGSSSDPGSATYRGQAPLSEPESAALSGLLDARDHALHASFHSGAEIILWPYGWTTDAPPEEAVYDALADTLTSLTGVPNGQTSKVLYLASGTTMDQAYGSAAGWRPISVSPEAYEGSGNAFDWWLLFNPPEVDASIQPVVDRWAKLVWHLITVAPDFAPASLVAPATLSAGPDATPLPVSVVVPGSRPVLGGRLSFDPMGAPVSSMSSDPVAVPPGAGPHELGFTLLPERGGTFVSRVVLDAGPAGSVAHDVSLGLVQVELALALERTTMGSPHTNTATATLGVGPFDAVSGSLSFRLEPSGEPVGSVPFSARPGSDAVVAVGFDALDIPQGDHEVVATASFEALWDDVVRPGLAVVRAPFSVVRPQVELTKVFPSSSPVGQPFDVLGVYRNTGAMAASDVVVKELVPPGYAYWFRDGPVPVPQDPLGSPAPQEVDVHPDGSVELTWRLGDVAPGAGRALRYRLVPLAVGEGTLTSNWTYTGDFGDALVPYGSAAHPVHRAT